MGTLFIANTYSFIGLKIIIKIKKASFHYEKRLCKINEVNNFYTNPLA